MPIRSTYPLQVVTEEEEKIFNNFKSKVGKYQVKKTLFDLMKDYNNR